MGFLFVGSIRVFSIKVLKKYSSDHIDFFVHFHSILQLDAYLDSSVITKPDRAPEHDYQYSWNCEPLRYDSSKSDEVSWHSECRWLSIDALKEPENEFLDKQGRVHLWARVDIFELSNYGSVFQEIFLPILTCQFDPKIFSIFAS